MFSFGDHPNIGNKWSEAFAILGDGSLEKVYSNLDQEREKTWGLLFRWAYSRPSFHDRYIDYLCHRFKSKEGDLKKIRFMTFRNNGETLSKDWDCIQSRTFNQEPDFQ